jgi:rhodanese-related sulfurtransferase
MRVRHRQSIDDVLATARNRIERLTPAEAYHAHLEGALLVDTRPEIYRETEGAIPGALVIERNVLEWRLDPASSAAIAEASYDAEVIVICNEGYASSLAAASLRDLGIRRATDLIGGYRAWRALGLPTSHVEAESSQVARYDAIVLS